MTVGGADLAGQAIKAGLVDELQLFLVPIVVGGGKQALPSGVRSDLELLDTRRFASGRAAATASLAAPAVNAGAAWDCDRGVPRPQPDRRTSPPPGPPGRSDRTRVARA